MKAPPTAETALLLQRARFLLLDFDGPVCSIFAGTPASRVANDLLGALRTEGVSIPERIKATLDPFEVLRFAHSINFAAADRTERRLREAEVAAVPTAMRTPHAADLITAWRKTGKAVAIVSNNSEAAVVAFASLHRLTLDAVVGRTSSDPSLLKPNPHLVERAVDALGAAGPDTVLVGDSPSDIVAAKESCVNAIGYANKIGKHARLVDAGADGVVEDLGTLLDALR